MELRTRLEEKILSHLDWLNWDVVYEAIKFLLLVVIHTLQKISGLFYIPKEKSLEGEVILVTGSANGLGREICRELASSGATLVLWDIASEDNARTAQELRECGVKRVIADTVDVSSRDKVREAALKVRHEVGPITILVNNAALAPQQSIFQTKSEVIEKTFGVNVLSQFWTVQEFVPDMMKSNKGHIVTISSTMAKDAMRGCIPYYSSKHASEGLMESMKDELDSMGFYETIKFTTIYPFFMKTTLTDEKNAGLRLKFRIPFLTWFLDPVYVAKRTVRAIRLEEEHVVVPQRFELYTKLLYPIMPREIHKAWLDFIIKEFKFGVTSNAEKRRSTMDAIEVARDKETTKSF